MVPDMHNKAKQEEAKRREQEKYRHHDKVGDFLLNMRENGVPHSHRTVGDRSQYCAQFIDAFTEFKHKIESGNYAERASTFGERKTSEQIRKYYSPFPKQRRFCCFIDRRGYYHQTSFRKQLRPMGMMGGRGRGMDMMAMLGGLMGMYEWVRTDTKVQRNTAIDEFTFFIPDDQYCSVRN